ncbi:MAG TPA: DUF3817 domain-containing protein [Candidatus Saccharimonadales bacterium]|nr:DUF3817 domain-containing protein [Candidatus Saccharimonadales bacterium]
MISYLTSLLRKFETNRVFTEEEGWMLFKLAAVGEGVGWTILIAGIVISKYVTPGNNIAVDFAGHIHGILFLIYAVAAGLYPTLRWSRKRAVVALLASVPPYGSILFEQWAWHERRMADFKRYRYSLAPLILEWLGP